MSTLVSDRHRSYVPLWEEKFAPGVELASKDYTYKILKRVNLEKVNVVQDEVIKDRTTNPLHGILKVGDIVVIKRVPSLQYYHNELKVIKELNKQECKERRIKGDGARHIVHWEESFISEDKAEGYIVYEKLFANGACLSYYMRRGDFQWLWDVEHIREFLRILLKAFAFLQRHDIKHNDVAEENIVFPGQYRCLRDLFLQSSDWNEIRLVGFSRAKILDASVDEQRRTREFHEDIAELSSRVLQDMFVDQSYWPRTLSENQKAFLRNKLKPFLEEMVNDEGMAAKDALKHPFFCGAWGWEEQSRAYI